MEKTFWQVAASDVYGSCRVATSHLKPEVKSDQSVAWSVKILVVVAKARCSGCFAATVHLSPHPRNRGVCAKISDSTSSRCQVCHVSLRRQQLIEIKPNGSAKPLSLDAWMWFWFLLSVNLFFGVDASIWVTAPQALLSTVMHRLAQDVWSPEHCIGKYSSKFQFFKVLSNIMPYGKVWGPIHIENQRSHTLMSTSWFPQVFFCNVLFGRAGLSAAIPANSNSRTAER